jgi:hypothetical protein
MEMVTVVLSKAAINVNLSLLKNQFQERIELVKTRHSKEWRYFAMKRPKINLHDYEWVVLSVTTASLLRLPCWRR